MAESKVTRENYINVQGWMISELNLKGNELIIYAIIYGFSQAENQVFSGSLRYLADWTNSTKQTVINCLQSLIDKGYIGKNEDTRNGVKFCEYYSKNLNGVLKKFDHPIQKNCIGGSQKSLPNNIDIDNISNTKDIYTPVVDMYHKICVSLPSIREVTDKRKKVIKARLNQYSMEQIEEVFILAESSDFLKGTNGKWNATFDWLMNENNFVKVLEGNYNNKTQFQPQPMTEHDRFMSGLAKFVEENE